MKKKAEFIMRSSSKTMKEQFIGFIAGSTFFTKILLLSLYNAVKGNRIWITDCIESSRGIDQMPCPYKYLQVFSVVVVVVVGMPDLLRCRFMIAN
jgi:hypothetical protein